MTKIDIEQIKADGPISEWFTKSEAGALWDSFSDPRLSYGREVFCRRIARVPDMEDALIEAVELLEMILKCTPFITGDMGDEIAFDCGDPYDLARNFLERFK